MYISYSYKSDKNDICIDIPHQLSYELKWNAKWAFKQGFSSPKYKRNSFANFTLQTWLRKV